MFGLLGRIMEGLTTEMDAFKVVLYVVAITFICSMCTLMAAMAAGGY